MTDLMESLESQHQASHPFHRSLGISQKTRDAHIPTAPATGCFYWNETGLKKKKTEGRLHKNLDTAAVGGGAPLTKSPGQLTSYSFSTY
jgi:hypothetical protein